MQRYIIFHVVFKLVYIVFFVEVFFSAICMLCYKKGWQNSGNILTQEGSNTHQWEFIIQGNNAQYNK